ncbi:hypothetical protein [Streptomyces sp. NPDC102360]|uniref:hypothetical protein n=1 Tax=Streptomyces sp. NPDC102360 TaxID=3366160 RepID=UPI003807DF9F
MKSAGLERWAEWAVLVGAAIVFIGNAMDTDGATGWRLWDLFLPAFVALTAIRVIRRDRRKRLARRRALLTRLDRLMQREVRRRR